jgi:hypothetical protein
MKRNTLILLIVIFILTFVTNIIIAQTGIVLVKFKSSTKTGLAGGEVYYFDGDWILIGTTDNAGEVSGTVPLKLLSFRVYWEGTYIQKNQNVSIDPTVLFETVSVKMELRASDNTTRLSGEGQVNSGTWKSLGNTPTTGMELLPTTYTFRIYYEDTYIQKNQNVAVDPLVVFETVLVKMELHASDHSTKLNGEGKVNSGSWKSLGNTPTTGMELLPTTYAFRIYYEDTYIQKNQNVAGDPLVVFETVLVQMELHSSSGGSLTGIGQVNSGSWKSMGLTPTDLHDGGKELLPQTYAFRIYYEDTYIQKNQNVASDQIVIFVTVLVKMKLLDSGNNDLVGAGQVNSGGWKSLGDTPTAGMELLPQTYAFRVTYSGTSNQKNQNVSIDPLIIFYGNSECSLTVNAGGNVTVYFGYPPQASAQLNATILPNLGGATFSWSPAEGLSDPGCANPIASPTHTTTYIVTVNANGCTSTDNVIVNVEDVTCGNKGDKVQIWHTAGNGKYVQICVSPDAIPAHLAHGDLWTLGKQNVSDWSEKPAEFKINPNYPNPFNPSTKISYQVPFTSNVEISVFNMLGEKVVTLLNEVKETGIYEIEWNASNLASGIYFYKMTAGEFSSINKMVLIK